MLVSVAGWQNPREVRVENGSVLFEVGMDHNHCPTCASRVRYIESQLASKKVSFDWMGGRGSRLFVKFDAPGQGVSIKQYVGETLNLHIN